MSYTLIIHEVVDYPVWKKVFDAASEIRKQAGEIGYQVLKDHQLSNKIIHFSKWVSVEHAKRFFESPELIELRHQAGVKSPEFIYLEELEKGVL